jgi:hypothetical protein
MVSIRHQVGGTVWVSFVNTSEADLFVHSARHDAEPLDRDEAEMDRSAENADEDELTPIRAHRQTSGGNQSREHTDHTAAHDVDDYRCQGKPQQRPFLMNEPVDAMTSNRTQRLRRSVSFTAVHASPRKSPWFWRHLGDDVPSVLLLMSKGNDELGREQSPFT